MQLSYNEGVMINPLTIFGDHDGKTIAQMWRCLGAGSAVQGVLCADGHYGYAQPVGGVIAYENHISISGVGFDIGCGNFAAKLDIKYNNIKGKEEGILKKIGHQISFGVGRTNAEKVEHQLFDSSLWKDGDVEELKDLARNSLGTVGGGNHYVDLFEDEEGYVWIGVHFGSRGLGHKTATKYLKLGGGKDGMDVAPCLLELNSELGQKYLHAMELAGLYAYAGREYVVDKVNKIVGGKIVDRVHNHHNYAWKEQHGDKTYWVVRKGATPAFPGQRGFVGGSMGDNAVIISGLESEEARNALYSTVHGAGRLFSRRQAKETFTHSQMQKWLNEKGVLLRGGALDESPMAYRRLHEVLVFHENTIKIEHTLRPFIVLMAGRERDPWKD